MKRTRAQNPKLQDPQDPAAAAGAANTNPKPQRKAKQPRQPKAGGKKALAAAVAAREVASAAASSASAADLSAGAEMAPVVPDVCGSVGGGDEAAVVAGGLPADWDEMGDGSPWWTFGVEEEKLLGWFPFVEEDFSGCHGGGGGHPPPEPAGFDDDIWRIHQIHEIPSYAAK